MATSTHVWLNQIRSFSTSSSLYGKRNFRKFSLYNKRGTFEYRATREEPDFDLGVRKTGMKNVIGHIPIPEMIPQLMVPDLTDFKLKPYVSYRVPDVIQAAFTPEDLFNACYADKIVTDFKEGKLDDIGNPLEPSLEEKTTPQEAWVKSRQTGSDVFLGELQTIDEE